MNIRLFPIIAVVLALPAAPLSAAPQPSPPHYTITDLGVDLRTGESGPAGLNDAGDVAGTVDASATSSEHRAFLYHRGKITILGNRDIRAAAINNRGQIACFSSRAAFLWDKGRMRQIGPLPDPFGRTGGNDLSGDVYVTGLNDRGEVVGNVFGLDGVFCPFLWQGKKMDTVFPARADRPSPFPSFSFEPRAINDLGQVVGFTHGSLLGLPPPRPILWDSGRVREEGTPGGGAICPYALNNKGQSAGMMYVGTNTHAFLWDGGNTVRDLGTAGGDRSEADGINDRGQIVGSADIHYREVNGLDSVEWGGSRAVLWQDGQAYNLNDLIPKDAGWVLERAVAINNRGQVVGTGCHSRDGGKSQQGGLRIFLLTPVKSANK
ncbi:MAG: hypothetical protein JO250_13325 [Armatimonadetes bacterium]|nr:hypothetical protein [Armatimonadota bacterium]